MERLARTVLKHGVRWQAGNGESIKVVKDPWVLLDASFRLKSWEGFIAKNMRVKDLFVSGEMRWDVGEVLDLFSMVESKKFLVYLLALGIERI